LNPPIGKLLSELVYNAISGQRVFIPGQIEPNSCGFSGDIHNEPIAECLPEDPFANLSDDVMRLQLAVNQYERERKQDIDRTFVAEDICKIYPSSEAPRDKCPIVKMRQQTIRLGQKDFSARMRMFEAAFQTNAIFTISVKPKDPTVFQMWYQRRMITAPKQDEALGKYLYESRTKTTDGPLDEESQPVKQLGFIRPFETFSSAYYGIDPIFEKIEGEVIKSAEDIQSVVAEIEDPNLKENMNRILAEFLEDKEAESVALMGHDKGRPYIQLFHKI